MKKVFVTGVTGFLGRHLLQEMVGSSYEVTALCRLLPETSARISGVHYVLGDIEDSLSLLEVMKGAEVVIHAAALVSMNPSEDHRMYQVNVLGTRNVVNACLATNVKRLIHVSSVAALSGSLQNQLIDEKTSWSGSNAGYGYTKYLSELEVFRGQSEGLEISIVNPSVILGRGDAQRSSGMIFKFINKGWPISLEGSANLVDARDVSNAIVQLMAHQNSGERYVLNGFSMPWTQLFSEVNNRRGKSIRYYEVPSPVAFGALWFFENFLKLFGRSTRLTAHTVRMATSGNRYNSSKIIEDLGFQFHTPESTLDWACGTDISKAVEK